MLFNNFLVSCLKLLQSQVSNEIVNNFIFHPIETLEISNVGNKYIFVPQKAVFSDMFEIYGKIL